MKQWYALYVLLCSYDGDEEGDGAEDEDEEEKDDGDEDGAW